MKPMRATDEGGKMINEVHVTIRAGTRTFVYIFTYRHLPAVPGEVLMHVVKSSRRALPKKNRKSGALTQVITLGTCNFIIKMGCRV